MQVKIREAVKEDLPSILELYKQPGLDDGEILSEEQAEYIFKKMSSYPNYKVYVAEYDGAIAGTFAMAVMDNLAHKGTPSGLVEDVVVSSEYRSNGIGKQMMDYAMECCRANGCYKLALSSNMKRERAHSFYESLGFKKHGYSFLVEL